MSSKTISLVLLFVSLPFSAAQTKPDLPRVVLIGDSIRMGYAPLVSERLQGKAVVISAKENGGDSGNVLAHLDEWAIIPKPDIIHLNAGLHDLKLSKQIGNHQVEIPQYESNLRHIISRIRGETSASIIFASTTPINDQRHAARKADFDRRETDVRIYNGSALRVMADERVPVNDLHWLVEHEGADSLLLSDGTHYTAAGYQKLAEAVSDAILRELTIRRYRALPRPESGPAAAAAYAKNEADRDAKVPVAFKNQQFGQFVVPASADAWRKQRPSVMKAALESLGDLPARPSPVRARIVARELRPGYILERVAIDNGCDSVISALLLLPEKLRGQAPAILWLHSSTPDKTQVIIPNTNGGEEPLGVAFVRSGYVVLSPDAYWHGDRVGTGPAGAAETGRDEQESLFKFHLWMGRTLWGMFVRDDQIALDYLASRPEVDRARIGTTGMSMGSTRAWWLGAVDERIAAVVAVACLTRYQNLIAHGQLRQHGVYYFTNGLLRHFDTEGVLALIAPRPFLALTGELDAGSPADGVRTLEDRVGRVYASLSARENMRSILYPETGHEFTPEMRNEMLTWFARYLK
jgi:dienelactone hydrolase/lysophospholipase L1-like esterase